MSNRINLMFVCQALDEEDRLLQSTGAWIKAFIRDPRVNVISIFALRTGKYSIPSDVKVYTAERHGKGVIKALIFLIAVIKQYLKKKELSVFIYQGGLYSFIIAPLRMIGMNISIYQWKAHPHVDSILRLQVGLINDLTFTSTKHSLPVQSVRKKIIGQAVDTNIFRYVPVKAYEFDLVTVGRVSPSKDIRALVDIISLLLSKTGIGYKLHLFGDSPDESAEEYWGDCLRYARSKGVDRIMIRHQAVSWDKLNEVLNKSKVFISTSNTALDRSVAEALVCGVPVISCNINYLSVLGDELKSSLYFRRDDISDAANKIGNIMNMSSSNFQRLREGIAGDYSERFKIDSVINRCVNFMV